MEYESKILFILTVGFALAFMLGYISQRLRLSPILGYLIAGYLIGPYSPGFVADITVAEQLAEIGVILMMFGVGLHSNWKNLIGVKNIAIPGAIGQTLIAAFLASFLVVLNGWTLGAGIVVGLAIGVASTVVLIRVLADNNLLETPQGHIALGWLIMEDFLTVIALILLPSIADWFKGIAPSFLNISLSIFYVLFSFGVLILIMYFWGERIVSNILINVARTRSHELFTLAVLALTFVIATGSAYIFGTSIALGAFIAGIVIGKTDVSHQVSANALPMRDAFAVLFFISVGMLFNPMIFMTNSFLLLGILAVVLIGKPLAAFLIVTLFGYSTRTALTIALALAQIGEFSFILAEESLKLGILPDEGFDILVACSLLSIALNPLLFQIYGVYEKYQQDVSLKHFNAKVLRDSSINFVRLFEIQKAHLPKVIIVGFGAIGQEITTMTEKMGFIPTIIDYNIDIISELQNRDREAVYGDASVPNILEIAGIEKAQLLAITLNEIEKTTAIIKTARQLNPAIRIIAHATSLSDQQLISDMNVSLICGEKVISKAFNKMMHTILKKP